MTYKEMGKIPSASNPNRFYIIKADEKNKLSCSCPAWRFLNGKGSEGLRYCKHLQQYQDQKLGMVNG